MPRGFFTQSAYVLFEREPPLDAIDRALGWLSPRERLSPRGEGWLGGAPELAHRFRKDANGTLVVDAVARPYPDAMGDPERDMDTFACWSVGGFGPLAFPGALARAVQHTTLATIASEVARHRALVRLRTTYTLGAGPDAAMAPPDHDPRAELELLAQCGRALLDLDGALAYFNPTGETLADRSAMDDALADAATDARLAIELHSNVRLWRLDTPGRSLMDTVGLEQLLVPDLEAIYPDAHAPPAIATLLREVSLHVLEHGDVFGDGDTLEGPGGDWRIERRDASAVAPPRKVVRLVAPPLH